MECLYGTVLEDAANVGGGYLLNSIKLHLPALHLLCGGQFGEEGSAELRVLVSAQVQERYVRTWQRHWDSYKALELTVDLV